MKHRPLGRTGLEVSVVGQGCWAIGGGGTWGPQDKGDSIAALGACRDAGIDFFDTAEVYGDGYSETLVGRALAGRRKEVVIATKVSREHATDPAAIKRACEASLERLRTDYIDLYQIHWPHPRADMADVMGALVELRDEGKIRAIGVSNFGTGYLDEILAAGRVESNQLCYSLLWRPIEGQLQRRCIENDISILCYSPLAQGLLTGKFASPEDVPDGRARMRLFSPARRGTRGGEGGCEGECFGAIEEIRRICRDLHLPMGSASLAWLLAQEGVTCVIVGGRNAEQVADNARAAQVELPADALTALADATEAVKAALGTNADPWSAPSRMERP